MATVNDDITKMGESVADEALRETSSLMSPSDSPMPTKEDQMNHESTAIADSSPKRNRSGRLYSGGSGSVSSANIQQQQQQQQHTVDSYAAAYAAANPLEQSSAQQQQQHSGAAGAEQTPYNTFGEPLIAQSPQTSSASSMSGTNGNSPAMVARQLSGLSSLQAQSDYSNAPSPASSYYASNLVPQIANGDYGLPLASNPYHVTASSGYQQLGPMQHHHQASYEKYTPATPMSHHQHNHYKSSSPLGYPTNAHPLSSSSSSYYDRLGQSPTSLWPMSTASLPFSSFHSPSGGGGIMSGASHALSHWTSGLTITEIICGFIAVSIGAIILGAPFFLIYLALMGNFSGSGTLSLTNPTGAAGAASASGASGSASNGRRKRLAIFEPNQLAVEYHDLAQKHLSNFELGKFTASIASQLTPFMDVEKISRTFKQLVQSIEKYTSIDDDELKKGNKW